MVILGSTGSIGTSALKVAQDIPEAMEVIALAAHSSVEKLAEQVNVTGVRHVAIYDATKESQLRQLIPSDVKVYIGEAGLIELSQLEEADMVLVSIVGTAGLKPALAAIEAGKELAVASKEILVMAGEVVMTAAREKGVKVLPVDSEHNAIFQCLEGHKGGAEEVSRLILTASGGPFRTWETERLKSVTLADALRHPTWDMGQKITIDSSTLFNKGLEMIEARWLFGITMDKVDVIVHPQSIVHSMVEFRDGSILAQLSTTDMCFPIQYAVTYPNRLTNKLKKLDFAELASLQFEAPRRNDFPALNLASLAGTIGGTLPSVLNAANEVAVDAFVHSKISFLEISQLVGDTMSAHMVDFNATIESFIAADQWAREHAQNLIATN